MVSLYILANPTSGSGFLNIVPHDGEFIDPYLISFQFITCHTWLTNV
jgi:hypothetical protein